MAPALLGGVGVVETVGELATAGVRGGRERSGRLGGAGGVEGGESGGRVCVEVVHMGCVTMRVDADWCCDGGAASVAIAKTVDLCAESSVLCLELANSLGEGGKLGSLLWGDGEDVLELCDSVLELVVDRIGDDQYVKLDVEGEERDGPARCRPCALHDGEPVRVHSCCAVAARARRRLLLLRCCCSRLRLMYF